MDAVLTTLVSESPGILPPVHSHYTVVTGPIAPATNGIGNSPSIGPVQWGGRVQPGGSARPSDGSAELYSETPTEAPSADTDGPLTTDRQSFCRRSV